MKNKRQTISPYQSAKRPGYCTTFLHPRKQKRLNRSLGTTDLSEAKEICLHLERLCDNPDWWNEEHPAALTLHPKAYELFFEKSRPKIDGTIAGHEYGIEMIETMPGGQKFSWGAIHCEELADARRDNGVLQNRVQQLMHDNELLRRENTDLRRAANKHVTVTLEEAFEQWKKYYPNGRNPHTVTEAKSAVGSFRDFVSPGILLSMIKAGNIDEWLSSYKNAVTGGDVSPVTKRRVRAYVSTFFSWAVRNYDLAENPLHKTGHIPGLARNPENIKAIRRPEELKLLIESLKCHTYWQAYVALGCLAGPRFSEQIHLRVKDVYLDNGYIRIASRSSGRKVTGTKTGRERNIPIETTTLAPILKKYLASHDRVHEWLFPQTVEELKRTATPPGQWSGTTRFLDSLRPILEKARKSVKGTGDFWEYGPAEYRHCFGTALGHSGFSGYEISSLMGNSEDVAKRHYVAAFSGGKRWPFKWRKD